MAVENAEVQGVEGADNVQTENENTSEALTMDKVQELLESKLAEKDAQLEEARKKWQSKIDTILSEKQTESKAKETLEEKVARLERERIEEKIGYVRESAKAKAKIDDELESALKAYFSTDVDSIQDGASKIAEYWQNKEAQYQAKIDELEKRVKYGTKAPPASSGNGQVMTLAEFNKLSPKERTAYMAKGGTIGE